MNKRNYYLNIACISLHVLTLLLFVPFFVACAVDASRVAVPHLRNAAAQMPLTAFSCLVASAGVRLIKWYYVAIILQLIPYAVFFVITQSMN